MIEKRIISGYWRSATYTCVYMSLDYHVQTLIGHRVFLNGYLKRKKSVLIQAVYKDIYSRSLQIVNFVMSHMLIVQEPLFLFVSYPLCFFFLSLLFNFNIRVSIVAFNSFSRIRHCNNTISNV